MDLGFGDNNQIALNKQTRYWGQNWKPLPMSNEPRAVQQQKEKPNAAKTGGGGDFFPTTSLPMLGGEGGGEGMNNKCTASSLFQPNICRVHGRSNPPRVSTTALALLEDCPPPPSKHGSDVDTCQKDKKSWLLTADTQAIPKWLEQRRGEASGFGLHCGWG